MRKVEKLPKPCKNGCGVILQLHPSAFTRRSFCSLKCKGEWQRKYKVGYWKGRKMPQSAREKMSKNHADISGNKNPRWRGGKRIDKSGYILIWKPEHPYSDYHGYVREHRLVIEESINRILLPEEAVHHIDFNKQNNLLSNLMLFKNGSEHQRHHQQLKRNQNSKSS